MKIYLNSQGKVIANANGKPLVKADVETYLPTALPTTATQLNLKGSAKTTVNISPFVKIVDANFKSWTVLEWHEAAVSRSFDKSKAEAAPIGYDIEAWGKHFIYYFRNKSGDPAGASKTYYDVTGTTPYTGGGLRHSAWQHTMDTFANPGASPVTRSYSIGETSVTATAQASGSDVMLSTSNSPFVWTIKKGLTTANAFDTDNARERYDALLAYTEWYRTLAALNTGISTTAADGTTGSVAIYNASGTRPAVGEDMYFYINGTNTNILAKYNATGNAANAGILGGDNLTPTMSDTIYNAQTGSGVNMNDGYESGADKVILTEGCKGAESYAYNGVWYITTPVISRANTTGANLTSLDYNIPDSPALSWIQWYNAQFSGQNVPYMFMPDERMLQAVKNNRPTCLNSMRTYLNHAQGESWGIPDIPNDAAWSVVRGSANGAWYVNTGGGYMFNNSTNSRSICCGVSAL